MATSCTKSGPYYSLEHPIKCPPLEYHFPMFKELKGFKLEMLDKIPNWCEGRPIFGITSSKMKNMMIFAKINRSNTNTCSLSVAFATHSQGMSFTVNRNKMEQSSNFKNYKEAASIFPHLIGVKVLGQAKVVEGVNDEDNIREWCNQQ